MIAITIKSALVLMALSLGSLAASQGGEFGQKKAYRQWSEKECRNLLENSPWAQTYTLSQTLIEPLQSAGMERARAPNPVAPGESIDSRRTPDPNRSDDTGRAREARPQIIYQTQFRSAPPIRQALVRLSQINAKYDQMQPDQQRAVDQKAEEFLAKRFPNTVVLYVSYRSNVQVNDRELSLHWQTQTTETLKNFVFLIGSGGEKVPLLDYWVAEGGGRAFQLIFPREYEGRPLASSQDKTLQLEFPHPSIRGQAASRVLIAFKVEKMLVDGVAVY
ncbi:MAG: hypothetical protein AABN33_12890 [Acidobacteriota bacterium]